MKLSLPLKLGIAVVLLFAAVIATCLLWTPVRVRSLAVKLHSYDSKEMLDAVESLLQIRGQGWQALQKEFQVGEDEVKFIYSRWSQPDEVDSDGNTILHMAAQEGYCKALDLFILKGADITALNKQKQILLHCGAQSGKLAMIKKLIGMGMEVDALDEMGTTPLWWAADSGDIDSVRFLITKTKKLNESAMILGTPLHAAAGKGHLEIAKLLIKNGAYIDASTDSFGGECTPLHVAVLSQQKKMVELLIANGADLEARTYVGDGRTFGSMPIMKECTPLGAAVMRGYSKIADILRSHGAKTGKELKKE
ncbi:MAG: ankyrin repeat domain-containing protein [Planctomycetota bacterium]|nr:MAG: ankyrin repeat domain-containing protein [Planctomycetota bacterium]